MIDHRLITLRTFASCGTIAATAELTGYSPSAISAQFRELQKELGFTVMVRDGRSLRLTAAGRQLIQGTDQMLADWERLRAAALNADDQVQSHLGLGGFSTAAAYLLAPLTANLRTTQPNVEVEVFEASPARCLDLLVAERIDLAVIVSMQAGPSVDDDARFEQVTLLDDPLDVVVPADHPLAKNHSVALEALAGEPWITDAPGSVYRALFVAAFTAIGYTPKIAHESLEWDTMLAFVGAGLGVGLMPRLASLSGGFGVSRLRIVGASRPARRIVAVVRSGSRNSPLIRSSLDFLQAEGKRISAERLAEEF
ncbi:LysR substrate-binding domain-containing protein [Glutamicibacter sp. NPDC087344]|uniref:LysR substrate-binding domain-containing protein n=1 Tax=Glutamicibacter sp. NPDC087344 TaxID=3363994 RepID=UPI0038139207